MTSLFDMDLFLELYQTTANKYAYVATFYMPDGNVQVLHCSGPITLAGVMVLLENESFDMLTIKEIRHW